MRRRRLPAVVPALVLALLATGCGVDPEETPEAVVVPPVPTSPSTPAEMSVDERTVLWFLRDGRLAPAVRAVPEEERPTVLDLLTAGPTDREVTAGLRTAVPGQPLVVVDDDPTDSTVTVDVGPTFTSLTGADQLRAVAQVVWTVTELPGAEQVSFTSDGRPIEVPTDEGLTRLAVDRADYASVAPRSPAPSPGDGGPTPDALPSGAAFPDALPPGAASSDATAPTDGP